MALAKRAILAWLHMTVACQAVLLTESGRRGKVASPYIKPSGISESSLHAAPRNVSGGPSWSWHHQRGRAYTMTYGITLDGERNLYLTSVDGVRKFTAEGKLQWEYVITRPNHMYNTASLFDGTVIGADLSGQVFALSMATGRRIWVTKICDAMGQNNGFTNVDNGIVVVDSHASFRGASHNVSGVNATDGAHLWTYTPHAPVWNFGAMFPGDGSVVFQDLTGEAYRLWAKDGTVAWTSGKHREDSFTDGTANIDSDGNVYTVENLHKEFSENSHGKLIKRRLSDGHILWQVDTPHPPNNQPAIGHGLVIQAMGAQQHQHAYTYVYAYDQETGEKRWVFRGPAQKGRLQAGDEEFLRARETSGLPGICYPNPWSAASFGRDGIVYIGNQEGGFYTLHDKNGDGVVSGPEEVTMYDTLAAFAGSSSPAIAPNMVAIASCDSLFVFKQ